MNEQRSAVADGFSLTRGGPFHRLQARYGYAGEERLRVIRRALLVVTVTWLPLFVLSLIQGQAYGTQIRIPFLRDFAVNVRFLIAAPILILAESGIDHKWRKLVHHFLNSGLVGEKELPSFESLIARIAHSRDRVLPEALMLVASFLPSFLFKTELLMGSVSNWHTTSVGSSQVTMAGWWFNVVSTPFFRFLLLRWAWRMCLWTSFLWRASRLNLYLVATHSDKAAGLGFLSEGQKAFSPIVFAGGAVVAAQVGNTIAYQGATLAGQKIPMIAYGVIAIIVLVAPLLVVTPALRKAKRAGLLHYGALVTRHNQLFDRKWIQGPQRSDEQILGNPDASSLADLGSSFSVVTQMVLVPIDKPTLITLAAAAALPMVPVIIYSTPADEVVRAVLKMLG
jgi:hypothetical protein